MRTTASLLNLLTTARLPGLMWSQAHEAPDPARWRALCDALIDAGFVGMSAVELLTGRALERGDVTTDQRFLLGLSLCDQARLGELLVESSASGFGVLLAVSQAQALSLPPRFLGALFGLGAVVASCGEDGQPLLGLPLGKLRDVLERSREVLSERCGYPVNTLWPPHDKLYRALDGLIIEEAYRAGYTRVLRPGLMPQALEAWSSERPSVVELKPWLEREPMSMALLARWARGEPVGQLKGALSGALGQLKGLA